MKRQNSLTRLLLFIFFLQTHEFLNSSFLEDHLCYHDEAIALLQFKEMFNASYTEASSVGDYKDHYSYPKMISWNVSTDCCSWDGVTCHQISGRVIGLDLCCSQLQGIIPSNTSLFHLSHLQRLNLAYNDFSGSRISNLFGSMKSLTHLNLSGSAFHGEVASEISHLSNLVSLDLSNNDCSMGFETILQNLTRIRELSLAGLTISSEITINLSSSLTYLDLSDIALSGNLPRNVFHMPNMQVLLLRGIQNFTGSLPKFNCSISGSLKRLELSRTNFPGKLTDSFGCLQSLNSLGLHECGISGAIPESIGNLTQLTRLDLGFNHFKGHVPSTISNLRLLENLSLEGNHLEGPIPDVFSDLQKLSALSFGNNSLVGQFPTSLLNLTHLEFLDLSNNLLAGRLGDFKSWTLSWIYLNDNQLSGPIPFSIFSFVNLQGLDLSSNNFYGIEHQNPPDIKAPLNTTINFNGSSTHLEYLGLSSCGVEEFPEFLINSNGLTYLDLSNNRIRGEIPSWFMSKPWDNVVYLNLSHNSLTSTVAQLPWENLEIVDISFNLLQGLLPSSICNSSNLGILDLSYNNLSSTIPPCLGNFSQILHILDLGNNGLFGTIPSTFSRGSMLRFLMLHDNQLEGPVPRSLACCGELQLLDLGNNKIADKFPIWLETLTNLQVIILKSNQFHGAIGNCTTKSPFRRLRVIDVSDNELTGVLPTQILKNVGASMDIIDHQVQDKYFGSITTIYHENSYYARSVRSVMKGVDYKLCKFYYIHSVSLVLKGIQYKFDRFPTPCTFIDFSSNRFEGEIPKSIGNLHYLEILNLSHNNFSGHIPSTFGNLSKLESLDLSWNQIEGTIPVELQNLTFLGFLNLSENRLVGRIPRARHFDTFGNDSYRGNLALCGQPLTKDCGDTRAPPSSKPFCDGFTWEAVLLGYACGLVLGLVLGSFMFLAGKPRWFIQIVESSLRLRKGSRKWIRYKLDDELCMQFTEMITSRYG